MNKITFATGNPRKLGEARAACDDFGIKVEQATLGIVEIQSHDPADILNHKINEAYKIVGSGVVVTDTFWTIPALNGFPGGYMHDVSAWFTPEDFINLVSDKSDKRISFTESIAYKDDKTTKIFSKEYFGVITDKPCGNGESIERVAEFDGFTLAERHDQGRFSHNPKDYIWYQFAKWYVGRKPKC